MSSPTRRLDERVLPDAALWLRRRVTDIQALLERLPQRAQEPLGPDPEPVPQPPLPERLRALDDRRARHGLLGFVADVPQVGAVVMALLLAIGAFTVAARQNAGDRGSPGQPGRVEAGADPSLGLVGIRPGMAVAPYLADATRRLQTLAATPDASLLAVIAFDHYITADEAADLAAPTMPTRAFYAPQGKGVPPGQTAYASVVRIRVDLPAQLAAASSQLRALARSSQEFAATIAGNNAEERAQKAEQLKDAKVYLAQAAAIGPKCACVFAVLVRGPARVLVELSRRPGIRVIDPAAPGSQTGLLDFFPLRPETTQVAPTAGPDSP